MKNEIDTFSFKTIHFNPLGFFLRMIKFSEDSRSNKQ